MNEANASGDLLATAVPIKKITSHDIKLGIRASFASGYQTFFEVGNDTGTRVTRHADAVAIGIWPSTGHQVHGFEVKVSRTDFLNEMKDPGKSMPVFKHCHRWSLATPPGLVKVDELPPNWGLVTFDGKSIRTVRQAPLLTPEPLTPGFVAAIIRRAGEADGALIEAAVQKARTEWNNDRDESIRRAVENDQAMRGRRATEAEAQLVKFNEIFGDFHIHDLDQMAPIVLALKKAGITETYRGIRKLLEDLDRSAAAIRGSFSEAGFDLPATSSDDELIAMLTSRRAARRQLI